MISLAIRFLVIAAFITGIYSQAKAASDVAVALGDERTTSSYQILFGTAPSASRVIYCLNQSVSVCTQSSGLQRQTTPGRLNSSRNIFVSSLAETITNNLEITVLAFSANGSIMDSIVVRFTDAAISTSRADRIPASVVAANTFKLQDMVFSIPSGFQVRQDAEYNNILIIGLSNGTDYIRVYVRRAENFDIKKFSGATASPQTKRFGSYDWQTVESSKEVRGLKGTKTNYVQVFFTQKNGFDYYGLVTSSQRGNPASIMNSFLQSVQ